MRSDFLSLRHLAHGIPQRQSITPNVSVTPARRESSGYVLDHGDGDPLPFEPDPEREAMADRIREHLKHLHAARAPVAASQASG
jgi:hypothetical protein